MSKEQIKKLRDRKKLIDGKLGKLNNLTASGAHKTMLHDELNAINRSIKDLEKSK